MTENMFYGATPLIFKKAEELRNNMTRSEEILWNYLKTNDWGLKFRRQHPVSNYIADFYCHQKKVVIEIDGTIHDEEDVKRNDKLRQTTLESLGLKVVRFRNEEVLHNVADVLDKIKEAISLNPFTNNFSPLGVGGTKLFVIKIGGNVIDNDDALQSFLNDFAKLSSPLQGQGAKCILVHGGGKIATSIGEKLGIKSNYKNGRRITDDATIDLVTMVYGGLINKKIVAKLQSLQCNALGLTGADGNIIPAKKRAVKDVDFGWVGDVESSRLKVENLKLLLEKLVLVFAPLTHDEQGHMLNTNADTIASSLAVALSSYYDVRLIYCFDKKGVLENVEDEHSVIQIINKEKYKQLVAEEKLFAGIIPKIDNAFDAINAGVKEVLIGDARDLLTNVGSNTTGTLITN